MAIKSTGNEKIDGALANLRRALVTLDEKHQVAGRKASRKRVSAAVKKLQKVVDVQFPPMRAKGKKRVKLTRPLLVRRLKAAGWKPLTSIDAADIAIACGEAGVRVRRVPPKREKLRDRNGQVYWREGEPERVWAPEWAVAIGNDVRKLRQARKSTQRKQAAKAEAALLK